MSFERKHQIRSPRFGCIIQHSPKRHQLRKNWPKINERILERVWRSTECNRHSQVSLQTTWRSQTSGHRTNTPKRPNEHRQNGRCRLSNNFWRQRGQHLRFAQHHIHCVKNQRTLRMAMQRNRVMENSTRSKCNKPQHRNGDMQSSTDQIITKSITNHQRRPQCLRITNSSRENQIFPRMCWLPNKTNLDESN